MILNQKQIDFVRYYIFVVTCCHAVYCPDAENKNFGKKLYGKRFDEELKEEAVARGLTNSEFSDCILLLEGHLDD
tara:strand:- start:236 stop:460 length:225 start_codon:yes stop_codon:yes gene_type:complete